MFKHVLVSHPRMMDGVIAHVYIHTSHDQRCILHALLQDFVQCIHVLFRAYYGQTPEATPECAGTLNVAITRASKVPPGPQAYTQALSWFSQP